MKNGASNAGERGLFHLEKTFSLIGWGNLVWMKIDENQMKTDPNWPIAKVLTTMVKDGCDEILNWSQNVKQDSEPFWVIQNSVVDSSEYTHGRVSLLIRMTVRWLHMRLFTFVFFFSDKRLFTFALLSIIIRTKNSKHAHTHIGLCVYSEHHLVVFLGPDQLGYSTDRLLLQAHGLPFLNKIFGSQFTPFFTTNHPPTRSLLFSFLSSIRLKRRPKRWIISSPSWPANQRLLNHFGG